MGTNPRNIDLERIEATILKKIQEGRILVGELTEEKLCLILKLNYQSLISSFW